MSVTNALDARLAGLEDHVKRLVGRADDDFMRRELAMVLHELSDTRLALLAPKAGDKRTTMRLPLGGVLTGRAATGELFDCGLHDISVGGALIEADRQLAKDQEIWLSLPAVAGEIETAVLGTIGDLAHLGFKNLSPETELELTKSIDGRFLRY
jgi:hypothetical protein